MLVRRVSGQCALIGFLSVGASSVGVVGQATPAGPRSPERGLAMFAAGSYVKVREGVSASENLEGVLCRVSGVHDDQRDIRRVDAATGALTGIEVRFSVAELVAAR